MPIIKIDHIISFSSEDSVQVANNLLSSDTSKKWKCKAPGEKNAVAVLQLEKASVITAIDIGNEHSAYVEVLVSRSGATDDYKVLLVASSFMTPIEARQSQNVNKVRMFTKEQFSKPECDEKWDRIKIVCTQPFNKHVQYGLSFINLHMSNEKATAPVQAHIGKFLLRPDSPDNLSAGSLFEIQKKLKQDKPEEKLTGAAAIREAASSTSLAQYGSPMCKPKLKTHTTTPNSKRNSGNSAETTPKPRDRNELLYSKDEEEPNEKIDRIMENKAKEKDKLEKEKEEKTPTQKMKIASTSSSKKKLNGGSSPKVLNVSVSTPSTSRVKEKGRNTSENDRKRKNKDKEVKKDHKKAKIDTHTKPFQKLLDGVILVISGIQNPDRAALRTSAIAMGAKYKPDWDNSCTHLICAFANTPKFNYVKGKGKIVTKKWLEDCYSQRKKLPWRRYALDKRDASQNESEDEICEAVELESPVHDFDNDSEGDYSEYNDEAFEGSQEGIEKILKQQEPIMEEKEKTNISDDSATDIESPVKRKENGNVIDIYDADTDEEDRPIETPPSLLPTSNLRSFFTNKKFYIDHSLSKNVYNKLQKYVVAYRGKIVDDPTASVDAIITMKENSNTLKEINPDTLCLNPDWVWECHNLQRLVPMDQFVF